MRVIGTEGVAIVIAPTAIVGIRKQHIRVAIIADPVVTTQRFGDFPGFPTQTTTRLGYRFVCRFCHRELSSLVNLLLAPSLPECGSRPFSLGGKLHEWVFSWLMCCAMRRSTEREVFSCLLFYHSPSSLSRVCPRGQRTDDLDPIWLVKVKALSFEFTLFTAS
jgi:hypothetical protein